MIGRDKKLHFLAGAAIAVVVSMPTTPLIGLIVATGVGIAKEVIWDYMMKRGTPELMDAVWTMIGAGVGAGLMTL